MSVTLRPATAADVPAIAACVDAAYTPYIESIGVRPGPLDFDHAAAVRDGLVTVAVDDADPVVGLFVLRGDWLENVAVDPAHPGRGLGRRLVEGAEAQARAAGVAELRLHTHARMTDNQARYRRLGWTETERRSDGGVDRVLFAKRL